MSYLPYAQTGTASWLAATGSSVLVHAGVLAATFGGLQQLFQPTEAAQPPDTSYTITLEQLDSDTLAGLVERLGDAGQTGEEPEGTTPDAVDPAEAEELAALQPDTLEEVEPDAPAAIAPEEEAETPEVESLEPLPEPETIEAPEAETVEEAAPEPETVEPVPETETLDPLPEPETIGGEDFAALTPETPAAVPLQPLSPVAVDPGPLVPETAQPVNPGDLAQPGTDALAALRPTHSPETIAPRPATGVTRVTPSTSAEAIRPATPQAETITAARPPSAGATPRPPAPPPSAQDLAVGDLIRRIRTAVSDACLLALPRRDGEDGVGLAMIASTDLAMEDFSQSVLTEEDSDVRQTRTLVDPRQCPAITYIRQNRDYPATRLGVRLESAEVPSGGRLTGTLRGTAGKYVLLLLVDSNGLVQDLQRFMSFSGNFARFDVPVTRAEAPRDTSQILLAIATARPANVIRDRAGRLAQEVFAGLEGDLAEGAALAVVTFDVR